MKFDELIEISMQTSNDKITSPDSKQETLTESEKKERNANKGLNINTFLPKDLRNQIANLITITEKIDLYLTWMISGHHQYGKDFIKDKKNIEENISNINKIKKEFDDNYKKIMKKIDLTVSTVKSIDDYSK